jgi:integrase/recombinase XerD
LIEPPPLFAAPTTRPQYVAFFASLGSKHTDRAYAAAASHFSAWCAGTGITAVEQVTPETAADYLAHCTRTSPPATSKQRAICLRLLLAAVTDSGGPFAAVPTPKVVTPRRRATKLSDQHLSRLHHVSTGATLIDLRDRAIVTFLITCFVPIRVLCALRTSSYYRNRKGTYLRLGRWSESYLCTKALTAAMDAYLNAAQISLSADGWLFRAIAGASGVLTERPLSQPDIYRIVRRRAKAAGITERISPRELRAAGLVRFFRQPHDLHDAISIAQDFADHGSWRSTIRYAPPDAHLPRKRRIDRRDLEMWEEEDERLLNDWGDDDAGEDWDDAAIDD